MELHPMEAESLHAVGQTDNDEAGSRISLRCEHA